MMLWRVEVAEAAEAFVAVVADFTVAAREAAAGTPDVSAAQADTGMPEGRVQATRLPVVLADPAIP